MPRTFRGRQLGFRKSARDAFLEREEATARTFTGPHGQDLYFQCGSCGHWRPYDSIHMGHLVEWATYLKEQGITEGNATWAEAQAAYNDLDNIEAQCRNCNDGHEWQGYTDDAVPDEVQM